MIEGQPIESRQPEIPPKKNPEDSYEITVMPDRILLQDYLRGHTQSPPVIFDTIKGVFERTMPIEQIQNRPVEPGEQNGH